MDDADDADESYKFWDPGDFKLLFCSSSSKSSDPKPPNKQQINNKIKSTMFIFTRPKLETFLLSLYSNMSDKRNVEKNDN